MTLEEAIKQEEEKYQEQIAGAEAVRKAYGEHVPGYFKHCQNAEQHRQLADWLIELQEYRNKKGLL